MLIYSIYWEMLADAIWWGKMDKSREKKEIFSKNEESVKGLSHFIND
jgi:hypothetical protein